MYDAIVHLWFSFFFLMQTLPLSSQRDLLTWKSSNTIEYIPWNFYWSDDTILHIQFCFSIWMTLVVSYIVSMEGSWGFRQVSYAHSFFLVSSVWIVLFVCLFLFDLFLWGLLFQYKNRAFFEVYYKNIWSFPAFF